MRTPIIAGNWKMHKTPKDAVAFANAIKEPLSELNAVERVVCPPYVALPGVQAALADTAFRRPWRILILQLALRTYTGRSKEPLPAR